MQTEFEIKILEIDILSIKKRLENLGAISKGSALQQRYVYDFNPAISEKRIRLRNNGKKTTLCIKHMTDDTKIDGMKELETDVGDFHTMREILKELGYIERAYQENRRTSYSYNSCDIEIDERPMIPPYLEIEGPSEEKVKETLKILGLENSLTTSETTSNVYKRYGIENLDSIKKLAF
ncbi:class IV adenylate cyclase [Candidatus Gracilibacteria bacterium]|nr:class IV adenylate cyclase [Candidatus Gracilibacteria bacterium]